MPSLIESQRAFAAEVLEGRDPAYEVYRGNVRETLSGALADAYPVIRRLVGEPFFRLAAARYIEARPSASGNLDDYGEAFWSFLRGFPPAASLPYLPDVARLEWACRLVWLHGVAAGVESPWPIHRIWQVNQPGWTGSQAVDLSDGAVRLAVRREDAQIVLEVL